MNFKPNWERLRAMRQGFLAMGSPQAAASAGASKDYWQDREQLAQYESSFARRIAWKWQGLIASLRESLQAQVNVVLSEQSSPRRVVDLGCGSGVASETLLEAFPALKALPWLLVDRSSLALDFSAAKLRARYDLSADRLRLQSSFAECAKHVDGALLLVSHVFTELSEEQFQSLLSLIERAAFVFVVEPGSVAAARRVEALRDALRGTFQILGPCLQSSEPCPARGEKDWCHQFVKPPGEVFQNAFWREFSERMQIDLRSLPVSWLCASRLAVGVEEGAVEVQAARPLGMVRSFKAHHQFVGCTADGRLLSLRVSKREQPEMFKALKKEPTRLEPIEAVFEGL